MPPISTLLIVAAACYMVISLATLAAFAIDKSRAQRPGARRISEQTLHTLSALGGFSGAMLAMWIIRHKNRKPMFVVITLAIAAAHVGAWVVWWMMRVGK